MELPGNSLVIFRGLPGLLEALRVHFGYLKRPGLARAMGKPARWSNNQLARYERGEVVIPIGELEDILRFFKLDAWSFLAALEAYNAGRPLGLALEAASQRESAGARRSYGEILGQLLETPPEEEGRPIREEEAAWGDRG